MSLTGIDKYQKLEKVGEGTYGVVYRAKDRTDGSIVALKKTRLELEDEVCKSQSACISLHSRMYLFVARTLNLNLCL